MSPDFPQLLSIGHHSVSQDWHIAPHHHSNHELVVIIEGAEQAVIEGRKHIATAGDVLFYQTNQIHEEWALTPFLKTYFIGFRWNRPIHQIPTFFPIVKDG